MNKNSINFIIFTYKISKNLFIKGNKYGCKPSSVIPSTKFDKQAAAWPYTLGTASDNKIIIYSKTFS